MFKKINHILYKLNNSLGNIDMPNSIEDGVSFKYNDKKQKGNRLVLMLITSAVLLFILIALYGPFKNSLFSSLYPKPSSHAAANQIYWGAYIEGPDTYGTNPASGKSYSTVPWDCNVGATICPTWDLFQSHAGKNTSLANLGFGQCWGSTCTATFNSRLAPMNAMVARKNIPVLGLGSFGHSNTQVLSGMDDPWITTFAQQAKAWGHPFMLRFDWEMNGNWFDWGGATDTVNGVQVPHKGNTPQNFIDMWKHVHNIFEAQGAKNVTWVWCPNEENASSIANGGSVSNAANYYPGDSYVDWTCFDVYNWGTIKDPKKPFWRTWEQMAGTTAKPLIYQHLLQIAPTKPIIVGETSSSETGAPAGTSKAAWFTDMLAKLPTEYPQIKALSFFFWKINDGGSIADWPIETSAASQNAFKAGIANPYYAVNNFANPPLNANGKILPLTPIATPTPVPTPTPNTNSVILLPVADTYIASDCPTCTDPGTATSLYTDASSIHIRKSFIRFDLKAGGGKTLTGANLKIHTTSDSWAGSVGTQNVQYVNANDWSEQYMDWKNTEPASAISSTPIGTFTGATKINTTYTIPLSISKIQPYLGGLYSVTVVSPSADNLTFGSRESSIPPQLILTFAAPTPKPTPSPTPTPKPTPTVRPTPTPTPAPITITKQVASSSDDVNQDGTSVILDDPTVWTGTGISTTQSFTGLRFTGISIPKGAIITSATLQVFSSQSSWITNNFSIGIENIGNSPTFSTTNKPSQRITTATISHADDVQWNASTWYTLNDMTSIVQTVINRADWQSGNALSVVLKGSGSAYARKSVSSFDGSAVNAPKLVITYH